MLSLVDLQFAIEKALYNLSKHYIVVHFQNGYSDFYELALKKDVYVEGENYVSEN